MIYCPSFGTSSERSEAKVVLSDRRRSPRVRLRLPVHLSPADDLPATQSETVDISRDGFFCITDQPFQPGQQMRCSLLFPEASAGRVRLDGTVEVVRVSLNSQGPGFGIGFCLRDYRLVEESANTGVNG
jgi:PilZ domain